MKNLKEILRRGFPAISVFFIMITFSQCLMNFNADDNTGTIKGKAKIDLNLIQSASLSVSQASEEEVPCAGCWAYLEQTDHRTQADENGEFVLENIKVGIYNLVVEVVLTNGKKVKTLSEVKVEKGKEEDIGEINLENTGVFFGMVQLSDGKNPAGTSCFIPGTNMVTLADKNGVWGIEDVPPGEYAVTCCKDSYQCGTSESVEVVTGDFTKVNDIILQPERKEDETGIVQGVVVEAGSDEPLAGVVVSAVPGQEGGTSQTTQTDGDGRYSLQLPEGEYTLVFSRDDCQAEEVKNVESDCDEITVIDVRLEFIAGVYPGQITGMVVEENGSPIPQAVVTIYPPVDPVTADDQGKFAVLNVYPGTFEVTASKEGFYSSTVITSLASGQAVTVRIVLIKKPVAVEPEPPSLPPLECYPNGVSQPCGTSNVGECRYGARFCLNGSWGECANKVDPSEEICDGKDNDCDGKSDETEGEGYVQYFQKSFLVDTNSRLGNSIATSDMTYLFIGKATTSYDDIVYAFDLNTEKVVGTIQTDLEPQHIYWLNDGINFMVVNRDGASFTKVNSQTRTVVRQYELVNFLIDIALSPDEQSVYAAGINYLAKVNLSTGAVETLLPLEYTYRRGIGISPDGSILYVTNSNEAGTANQVIVYNTNTKQVVKNIITHSYPVTLKVSADGGFVYVLCNQGEYPPPWDSYIDKIDTASREVVDSIQLDGTHDARDMVLDPDGRYLYISNWYSGGIDVIYLNCFTLIDNIPTGSYNQLGISEDGDCLFVGTYGTYNEARLEIYTR